MLSREEYNKVVSETKANFDGVYDPKTYEEYVFNHIDAVDTDEKIKIIDKIIEELEDENKA